MRLRRDPRAESDDDRGVSWFPSALCGNSLASARGILGGAEGLGVTGEAGGVKNVGTDSTASGVASTGVGVFFVAVGVASLLVTPGTVSSGGLLSGVSRWLPTSVGGYSGVWDGLSWASAGSRMLIAGDRDSIMESRGWTWNGVYLRKC